MTYKITSTRQQETVLFTTVEYTFGQNIVTVEVAHFNPQSTGEIDTNILNRAGSELEKLTMINNISSLINTVEIDVEKDIDLN